MRILSGNSPLTRAFLWILKRHKNEDFRRWKVNNNYWNKISGQTTLKRLISPLPKKAKQFHGLGKRS